MPDEKICPVVRAYTHHAREHLCNDATGFRVYSSVRLNADVLDQLDAIRLDPLALLRDRTTQRLRAFFCLHGLFILIRTRMGGPSHKLPLTREGIQSLIKFCSEARDTAEVRLYATQLSKNPVISDLMKFDAESLIALTDTVVEAAEYLRPRLSGGRSLAGLGRLYVKGLAAVLAPADSFVTHGRQLIHVSVENRGDLENV